MGRVSELAARLYERDVRRLCILLSLERPSVAERIETDELAAHLQVRCHGGAMRQDNIRTWPAASAAIERKTL